MTRLKLPINGSRTRRNAGLGGINPQVCRGGSIDEYSAVWCLVLLAEVLLLALALGGLGADLLVVLLEGGEILAGLGEL